MWLCWRYVHPDESMEMEGGKQAENLSMQELEVFTQDAQREEETESRVRRNNFPDESLTR